MTFDERLRRARDDYRSLDVSAQADAMAPPPPDRRSRRARAVVGAAAVAACVLLAVAVVVLRTGDETSGVDTVAPSDPTTGTEVGAAGATFPDCNDVRSPEAPADRYRATPAYVGNDYPRDEVRAWAETQPGYVNIWADRNHNGWLTVAFSDHAVQHQADLEERFPGVGVVAVQVDWTLDELLELQDELNDSLRSLQVGTGTLEHKGVVQVDLGVKTPERLAALEPFAGERICVNGIDVPEPGPPPLADDAWRLLGEDLTGEARRTGVATDDMQYAALWAAAGLTGERPAVDFEDEIVIWFGLVYSSSCPIDIDNVAIGVDRERAAVHLTAAEPSTQTSTPRVCTSDARPHAFVVAVDRSELPVGPFVVQFSAEDPPVGRRTERTNVTVDLSRPGSTATDEQLAPEPPPEDADLRNEVGSGGDISVGDTWPYRLVASCDAHVLGVINGVLWETAEVAPGVIPDEWRSLVDEDGVILVDIVLSYEGPTLVATANGRTVTYQPSSADRTRYEGDGECVGPYR